MDQPNDKLRINLPIDRSVHQQRLRPSIDNPPDYVDQLINRTDHSNQPADPPNTSKKKIIRLNASVSHEDVRTS